jgi:hypothetical protein
LKNIRGYFELGGVGEKSLKQRVNVGMMGPGIVDAKELGGVPSSDHCRDTADPLDVICLGEEVDIFLREHDVGPALGCREARGEADEVEIVVLAVTVGRRSPDLPRKALFVPLNDGYRKRLDIVLVATEVHAVLGDGMLHHACKHVFRVCHGVVGRTGAVAVDGAAIG